MGSADRSCRTEMPTLLGGGTRVKEELHQLHVTACSVEPAYPGPLKRALQKYGFVWFCDPGRGGSGGPREAPEGHPSDQ